MRVSKEHEQRKNEILDVAENLFVEKGFNKTTINDILQAVGIAKGTFYHYFASKEQLMHAIIMRIIIVGTKKAQEVAQDKALTVHEKLLYVMMSQKPDESSNRKQIAEQLHQAENAQMNQKSMVETIRHLEPILTQIVCEGVQQGVFHTPYAKESVEFLLLYEQTIFSDNIFNLTENELLKKIPAFLYTMEVILQAPKNSFADFIKLFK